MFQFFCLLNFFYTLIVIYSKFLADWFEKNIYILKHVQKLRIKIKKHLRNDLLSKKI